ncbi:hypothetical protein BS50DRAFT_80100 [Corynespora cassiicola Philippines]|uniref:Uncharacterized protein n=1 Tax=Corynespora cassiicola Philippines TaxID=1448308 RepID=A0A2T2NI32_CORCC|nr:hypothetical protein BS50DRAFT_80100 [Corynespora cassiicola Philippines]
MPCCITAASRSAHGLASRPHPSPLACPTINATSKSHRTAYPPNNSPTHHNSLTSPTKPLSFSLATAPIPCFPGAHHPPNPSPCLSKTAFFPTLPPHMAGGRGSPFRTFRHHQHLLHYRSSYRADTSISQPAHCASILRAARHQHSLPPPSQPHGSKSKSRCRELFANQVSPLRSDTNVQGCAQRFQCPWKAR